MAQPRWGWGFCFHFEPSVGDAPTVGFETQSLWDYMAGRSEGDQNFYESKCATLDRQIDQLVYELYDLMPDEIAIVEGSGQ